jgi:hypothetical protein
MLVHQLHAAHPSFQDGALYSMLMLIPNPMGWTGAGIMCPGCHCCALLAHGKHHNSHLLLQQQKLTPRKPQVRVAAL